jgi:hypothetical protein
MGALLLAACAGGSGGGTDSTALTGEFVAGGILADDAQSPPAGDARIVRFDGAGGAEWTGQGKAFAPFSYEAYGDGSLSVDDVPGVLSADGEVIVLAQDSDATGVELWAAVKASPGTRAGTWRGTYFGFAFSTQEDGPYRVSPLLLEPDGTGTVGWQEVGRSGEGFFAYGVRDGILSVMGSFVDRTADHTTGAVTTDGSVVILTDLQPPEMGLAIAVQASPGVVDRWNGTYECCRFGLEVQGTGVGVAAARVAVEADGAGTYRISSLDGSGGAGGGTYTRRLDGMLLLDNGLMGMVSPDGTYVVLGLDGGDEMSLLFGVRR